MVFIVIGDVVVYVVFVEVDKVSIMLAVIVSYFDILSFLGMI